MKILLMLVLLFLPVGAWASEATDRASIGMTMAALNDPAAKASDVWAPGVDGAAERRKLSTGPMSEVYGGKISSQSIRFVTPKIALVDATQSRFGSLILSQNVPLVLMLKKVRKGWRISELRVGTVSPYPNILQIP
jgi:hypothetical protein